MVLWRRIIIAVVLLLSVPSFGIAADVALERARTAAQNWLQSSRLDNKAQASNSGYQIVGEEIIEFNNQKVGYNFVLSPAGHIIVPSRDELPVVKLYSFTTTLSMTEDSEVVQWIKEELYKLDSALDSHAVELAGVNHADTHNGRLWVLFGEKAPSFSQKFVQAYSSGEMLSLGPLISTAWDQGDPYNLNTPLWYNGSKTYTGCVATAAAQIMKYWNWPATGQGSTSYSWYNGSAYQTLSANFAASTYDWTSMTNTYGGGSTTAQRNAVAKLMSDVGVAFHMNYGPTGSGAVTLDGVTVFPTYFKYKNTIQAVYRTGYASDGAWMQVFKNEVQNGRPSQLRIRETSAGGHSIVVDGYRDSPSEQIHLNFGWSGNYNGWYVSNNIVTGSYNWSDPSYQAAVIGIEPNTAIVAPTVTTAAVTGVLATTATCGGNVTSDGGATVTAKGVCWSTAANPTTANTCTNDGTGTGFFTSSITGLIPTTTYHVRAYATNSIGTSYGSDIQFSSTAYLPTVTTTAITGITQSTASGGGNVTSDGGASVTARGVCWSTAANPTTANSCTNNGTSTGTFSSSITGLMPLTTYHVRAYATNSAGTGYGGDIQFTTTAALTVPTVTTSTISGITMTAAASGGNVTSDGGTSVTAKGVCWSTAMNPNTADTCTNDGTGTGSFTSSISGLTANTTYHVRAYATNLVGTGYGNDIQFSTLAAPTIPSLGTLPITSIMYTTASGGGYFGSDGGAPLTAKGVCWSTLANPTLADICTNDGVGLGSFTSSITSLSPNTTYHVRAYATNAVGTAYGNDITFTTGLRPKPPTLSPVQ